MAEEKLNPPITPEMQAANKALALKSAGTVTSDAFIEYFDSRVHQEVHDDIKKPIDDALDALKPYSTGNELLGLMQGFKFFLPGIEYLNSENLLTNFLEKLLGEDYHKMSYRIDTSRYTQSSFATSLILELVSYHGKEGAGMYYVKFLLLRAYATLYPTLTIQEQNHLSKLEPKTIDTLNKIYNNIKNNTREESKSNPDQLKVKAVKEYANPVTIDTVFKTISYYSDFFDYYYQQISTEGNNGDAPFLQFYQDNFSTLFPTEREHFEEFYDTIGIPYNGSFILFPQNQDQIPEFYKSLVRYLLGEHKEKFDPSMDCTPTFVHLKRAV